MIPRDEKYHQMCMKAQDVQNLWKREYGDQYLNQQHDTDYLIIMTRSDSDKKSLEHPCYWIPSQHQLQELIRNRYKSNSIMLLDFLKHFFYHDNEYGWTTNGDRVNKQFNTMEKLWLAFVMFTLHTKFWNGEEWVSP